MSNRSIILCEGFDEVYILGYYLFKTNGWKRIAKNKKFSEYYSLPKVNPRNQLIEIYEKMEDRLAIWSVGGKDSFSKAIQGIKEINLNQPEYAINQIFIIQDRDSNEVKETLEEIRVTLDETGIKLAELKNNTLNSWNFESEGENYTTNIIPIVLPFDQQGAIETILMRAISESSEEENYIVNEANKYIERFFIPEVKLNKYLKHQREILKARFSAVISVTNPDRSTATFNTLLMSHSWEEKEEIKKHFGLLNTLL